MKKSALLTSVLLVGSFVASPAVLADPGHGKGYEKQHQEWKQQQRDDDRRVEYKRYNDDNRYYNSRTGQYLTRDQYRQLPPGLQKNVARGKAVPPGWARKLDNRYYSTNHYNNRDVYVLNDSVYRRATVIGHPRPGTVRLRVNDRVLDVLEATRIILNVL